jgi:hypothetical protein
MEHILVGGQWDPHSHQNAISSPAEQFSWLQTIPCTTIQFMQSCYIPNGHLENETYGTDVCVTSMGPPSTHECH